MSPVRTRFNFFALVGELEAPSLARVHVTAALQRELSDEFAGQLARFGLDRAEIVSYTPQYRTEEGELSRIEKFTFPASIPGREQWLDQPSLGEERIERGEVRALVGVEQGDPVDAAVCFQAVDARQILKRSRFSIILTNDTFARSSSSGLVVREELSAVLRGGDLYFRSESELRRFIDLAPFLVEASQERVEAFFGHPAFAADDLARTVALADLWTRRKIASIENQGILDKVAPQEAARVAERYGVRLATRRVGGKVRMVLPATGKELKALLRLLDQDFLDSRLTPDRFLVNSKRRV
jgi:hypothetical protein